MSNTNVSPEQTSLEKFNQKLRNAIFPGIKLSKQEEIIVNIIFKILNDRDTIKIVSPNNGYYLMNYTQHYYVKIQHGYIAIINTADSIIKDCTDSFESYLKKMINSSIAKDTELIDKTIFNNEVRLLETIERKFQESSQEPREL